MVDGENSTQGWNRYSYCHNNPVVYRDPTGHGILDKFGALLHKGTEGLSQKLQKGGEALNSKGAEVSEKLAKASGPLNKLGKLAHANPETTLKVTLGVSAAIAVAPMALPTIGSVLKSGITKLLASKATQEAAVMGTINAGVQVGSNIVVNKDKNVINNIKVGGVGFISGAVTSVAGIIPSPILKYGSQFLAGAIGDIAGQVVNKDNFKIEDLKDANFVKAAASGVVNTAGGVLSSLIGKAVPKLTLPETATATTGATAPVVFGIDTLSRENK